MKEILARKNPYQNLSKMRQFEKRGGRNDVIKEYWKHKVCGIGYILKLEDNR